jgi:hypothetical protein
MPATPLDCAGTIGTIASGLEETLSAIAPPEVVVGLIEPLAAGLNQGLGGLLAALNATANGGPAGLPALLEGATGGYSAAVEWASNWCSSHYACRTAFFGLPGGVGWGGGGADSNLQEQPGLPRQTQG